jgi:hypothetical protein
VSSPKTFISYSWSSPEHQQWVIDLATRLREDGIDAILDKWDLKEGHDAIAFMEKMVTDATVEKVIIVSDRVYSEKADGRRGGVGTETQIISPQVYARADQNKFVVVTSEVNADGKPFLPTYYGSRIYIDLSSQDIYPENYEQLVRWIFDKPAFPKPQIGKPPAYLDESTVLLPTKSRAMRATDLIQKGSSLSDAALREYLEALAGGFEALRLDGQANPFDDAVIESIGAFLPYREEFVRVISTIARHKPNESTVTILKRFYESIIPFRYPPPSMGSWRTDCFDNYKFINRELFLHNVAIFLKYEILDALNELLTGGFYVGGVQHAQEQIIGFEIFSGQLESLEFRNGRLKLGRLSLEADILRERAKASGVSFDELMQADFLLFIRDAADALKAGKHNRWYPNSLVFSTRRAHPFEMFARAQSRRYFETIKGVLGVKDKPNLETLVQAFGSSLYLPRWQFDQLEPQVLIGVDRIATLP